MHCTCCIYNSRFPADRGYGAWLRALCQERACTCNFLTYIVKFQHFKEILPNLENVCLFGVLLPWQYSHDGIFALFKTHDRENSKKAYTVRKKKEKKRKVQRSSRKAHLSVRGTLVCEGWHGMASHGIFSKDSEFSYVHIHCIIRRDIVIFI